MAWSERIKDEMLINEYLQVGKGPELTETYLTMRIDGVSSVR